MAGKTQRPAVPFTPEPFATLRARVPAALAFLYDARAIIDRDAIRPGEVAANVFDGEHGTRLIVSRTKLPSGDVIVNVSGSVFPGTPDGRELDRLFARPKPARRLLAGWVVVLAARVARLLDRPPGAVHFLGFSPTGVAHFSVSGV
jgi:hypothetical protein